MKDLIEKELKDNTIHKMMKEPGKLLNGIFNIGFDVSKNEDHCCLVVGKCIGLDQLMIISEFYDEEASELFNKLMGLKDEK